MRKVTLSPITWRHPAARRQSRVTVRLHGELLGALSPLLARLRLKYWLARFAGAALVGGLCALAVSLYSWIIPLPGRTQYAVAAGTVAFATWMGLGLFGAPTAWDAVRAGDAAGLEERLVTAAEYGERSDPLFVAQRQDALLRVKSLDAGLAVPIVVSRRRAVAVGAVLLAAFLLLAMPSRFQHELDDYAAFHLDAEEQAHEIRKVREAIEKTADATGADVSRTIKELRELEQMLKSARTPEQALKALSKAESGLAKASQPDRAQELGRALDRMAGALSESDALRQAASKMAAGNWSGAASDIKAASQQLTNLDEDRLEEAARALQKASSQAAEAGNAAAGLAQSAAGAAGATSSGDLQAAAGELQQMAQQLEAAGDEVNSSQASATAMAAVAAARYGTMSQAAAAQGGSEGQGTGRGQGTGASAGTGPGSGGQGTSGSQGISTAAGTGQGASGAGTGSTNQASGQGGEAPGTTAGSGSQPPPSRLGAYEKIYAPERLGGDSGASVVPGKAGSGSSDFVETPRGATTGKSIPYGDVFYDFQRRAVESLDRSQIPAGMRDFVRRYFSSLEPQGGR